MTNFSNPQRSAWMQNLTFAWSRPMDLGLRHLDSSQEKSLRTTSACMNSKVVIYNSLVSKMQTRNTLPFSKPGKHRIPRKPNTGSTATVSHMIFSHKNLLQQSSGLTKKNRQTTRRSKQRSSQPQKPNHFKATGGTSRWCFVIWPFVAPDVSLQVCVAYWPTKETRWLWRVLIMTILFCEVIIYLFDVIIIFIQIQNQN